MEKTMLAVRRMEMEIWTCARLKAEVTKTLRKMEQVLAECEGETEKEQIRILLIAICDSEDEEVEEEPST
jgi:hypothetical protein